VFRDRGFRGLGFRDLGFRDRRAAARWRRAGPGLCRADRGSRWRVA
jgi:hypothetical protein